jgi:alpha-tubulin suppressor-like RCC1 family protein
MPYEPTTNFRDSDNVDLGKKLVTKDYLLEVYGTILESSPASGLIVTPELWVWGDNNSFKLGDGSGTTRSIPVAIGGGGTNWKQVSCGRDHQGAIKTDGTLWMWGSDNPPALGINGVVRATNNPVTTFAGGTNWKQISCGFSASAAIKTDGTLWTWGRGTEGQLGDNNVITRSTPVTTFAGGNNWKQVSCGQYHTAAIKTDGSLWLWGRGTSGQLGNFATTNRSTPVTTFAGGNTWKQVSAQGYKIAAVKTDGTLWIWGTNFLNQLPINATGDKNTPVTTFAGGTTWKQTTTSMAIKTDGTLWTWGTNGSGQLGTNDTTTRSTPVTTFAGGTNWKSLAFGFGTSAAIKTDGTLWTWGGAGRGQLGTNDTTPNRLTPVTTFAGGNNWKQASSGFERTAAIQTIDYI